MYYKFYRNCMKRTKIVATIGPASESPEVLKGLSKAGVNVFRLNFSHGTHKEHETKIDLIRQLNLPGGIMLDTKGPEIRTGEVRGEVPVNIGDKIIFTIDKGVYEDTGKISINYKEFINDVKVGTIIVVDSGVIDAKVMEIHGHDIICRVVKGSGKITTKRHVNLMGEHVSLPTITENDLDDINFGIKKKVDFIALSFTRTAKDIEDLREYCRKKGHVPHIIPKIENGEAIGNLEEIVKASDGIMVARGDLACEIPFAKVPQIQKQIIELCDMYSKPVIIATQMLLSMVDNITPTRAEVSDVANAVYEGADAVMTSDETTKGFDPVNVIQVMNDIVSTNEEEFIINSYNNSTDTDELNIEMIKSTVRAIDYTCGVDSIIVLTKSGRMAEYISSEKPSCPIFAFTDNDLAKNTMSLLWGVYPEVMNFDEDNYEKTIQVALNYVKSQFGCKRCLLISYYKTHNSEYPLMNIRDL